MSVSKAHAFKPYATCLSFHKEGLASSNEARTPGKFPKALFHFQSCPFLHKKKTQLPFVTVS